ncbi:PhzF family phenazine biosynthesis protein [Shimia biformata]|uniref:PhzF family phenazine biosynthesis protein n=1 Tax=Shimia biformata TaxID=1294299 RepID=UPI001951DF4B|nr:PhzF family phenazine biosynthesis protein [Shimia biformata]
MVRHRHFMQVDVFSSQLCQGNGLAVVLDAVGLSDVQMQRFAAWTNLAETAFIFPPEDPGADYKLRIFTPGREMVFAGHPTLGSCMAWLAAGGRPRQEGRVVQECGIGLVEIDVSGGYPFFAAPDTKIAPLDRAATSRLISDLKLAPERVVTAVSLDNGPDWKILELVDAEAVMAVDSSLVNWPDWVAVGLIGRHPEGNGFDYEVRNIAPSSGMSEDPITGSLVAALAQWLRAEGRLTRDLRFRQGTVIDRAGEVFVIPSRTSNAPWIGGHVTFIIDGTVTI